MALSDYLAKNYLSADKPSKKRKRKHAAENGLNIADDADDISRSRRHDSDDDGPTVVDSGSRTSFKSATTWKTIGAQAPTNAEQEAADAILSAAEAERVARHRADEAEDAPAIVGNTAEEEDDFGTGAATMANGALAGLQTAAQVSAALARREKEEKKRMEEAGLDAGGKAQETIYRDASGRVINVAMARAEKRREAEDKERREREEKGGAVGDVQRREREGRKRDLEEVRTKGVARGADDEELNRELKGRERWNDPMAAILEDAGVRSGGKVGRKKYEGASEPNRYGIKPGYRWDGVDRSNGFERKWFAARNKQKSHKELEYAWEMDE